MQNKTKQNSQLNLQFEIWKSKIARILEKKKIAKYCTE